MARGAYLGNYVAIASQVLRALRGNRSQKSMAKRLGYRANPMTDWENGRRCPSAQEFLRASDHLGRDVCDAFASFHSVALNRREVGYDIASWLNGVRGSTPIKHLAEQSGFSRFSLQRWFSGAADPRLHEFLCLVDVITGRVYDLVAALVPIEQVPLLRERCDVASTLRSAAYLAPWSEAILRVIETPRYQAIEEHEPGYIARVIGISREEEETAIGLLVRAGVLRLDRRIYKVLETDTVDTRGDKSRVAHLLQHWAMVARSRIEARGPDDFFAYNVFAVSPEDLTVVREILRRAFRELRALVVATSTSERVALVNVQLVALDRHGNVGADG